MQLILVRESLKILVILEEENYLCYYLLIKILDLCCQRWLGEIEHPNYKINVRKR